MKKHLIISFIFLLMSFNCISQNIESINSNLKIPNKLDQSKELRIYKRFSIINATEILRIYKTGRGLWNIEFYKFYSEVPGVTETHFESLKLKSQTNLDLVWLYLLDSNVEYLPSLKQIDYKLKSKGEIICENGEYDIIWKKKSPLDGVGYEAFFKDGEKSNYFEFGNYDSYLKDFPEVDELNYYSQIIKILNNEFDIWK